ncbi:MAG: LysM peptidoglycan-binding domain-containing protein [Acidimicrobiales bacterium]|nr:LysM peptidoglycan-binding domain-containing protein [Acidimicrobiales bacterium]
MTHTPPSTAPRPIGSRAGLVGASFAAAGASIWLTVAAPATLALPGDEGVAEWFAEVGPLGAAMTGARVAAIGLAGWVALLAAAHVLPATGGLARRCTPPALLPLFLALGSACTASSPVARGDETAYLIPLETAANPPPPSLGSAPGPSPAAPAPVKATPSLAARDPGRQQSEAPADAAPARAATWTVAPGDHLWSIAVRTLEDAWHRAPTDAETVPYWRALIAANQSVLLDPTNADLIVPGQRLIVPPVPLRPI